MDMLQGTLDVLVLRGLTWGPKHGYAVARWIETTLGRIAHRARRRALHRAPPDGGPRADRRGVGRLRARPARKVLSPDAGRTQTPPEPKRRVGAAT